MESILQEIFQCILDGHHLEVGTRIQQAFQAGFDPKRILDEAMIAAMAEVGRLFDCGEFYVPEMLVSARAMQAGMVVLKPYLKEANIKPAGKVAIGTVKGDLHDIGKNLVLMMLEGAGFEILDLGTDVPPERFLEAAQTEGVNILALSALLSTTMASMQATIAALNKSSVRQRVKVMVGGAPITEGYSRLIGADGFAPDASQAVALAKSLLHPNE
jgi:5-methyltetrahydrofolate--homocysteine methyltransferase